jgi:prepilin-type N-terminal cleavage/methylation domain-containing protein
MNGFTLVELLIVVAIIAILSAIAIPQLLGAREKSRHASCQTALHTLDGDVVNRMEYYEGIGDPAAADKAIDDVIQLTQVQPQIQNPRNMGQTPYDPGYVKALSSTFVPTADTTCKVFMFDASSTLSPPAPTVVMTQYEVRVRSYRVSLH